MNDEQRVPTEQATPEPMTPKARVVDQEDVYKRCPHCGKRLKMLVLENSPDSVEQNAAIRLLVRLFSPGGVDINQRYRCPRCADEFNDMTLGEAVVAPALMVLFLVVTLAAFLWFVLYYVA